MYMAISFRDGPAASGQLALLCGAIKVRMQARKL